MEEIVDLINEKDEVIGTAARSEVKAKKLLYRSAGVYLERNGKIALEKRSMKKAIRPGNWSIVEETVQSGETFEQAAARGMKEELGLEAKNLKFIGKKIIDDTKYPDKFMLGIFSCTAKGDIKLQEEEVEKVRFLMPKQVEAMIRIGKNVSPGLSESFGMYMEFAAKRGAESKKIANPNEKTFGQPENPLAKTSNAHDRHKHREAPGGFARKGWKAHNPKGNGKNMKGRIP